MADDIRSFENAELTPLQFRDAIYTCKGRVRAPVCIYPQNVDGPQNHVTAKAEAARAKNLWVGYVVTGGIGQYSLVTGLPLSLFAMHDVVYRTPTTREMKAEHSSLGDDVIGREIHDLGKVDTAKLPVIKVGRRHYAFKGPRRVAKSSFRTEVLLGTEPVDFAGLRDDVSGLTLSYESGHTLRNMGTMFFFSANGRVSGMKAKGGTVYAPELLHHCGDVEITGGAAREPQRLIWVPQGNRENATDISQLIKFA